MIPSHSVVELDQNNAAAWLRERLGIEASRVEPLPGGVSNTVLLIEAGAGRYVLKQSLGKLRTKEEWLVDRARILRESRALRTLAPLLPPGAVPEVVHEDARNFTYIMTAAAAAAETWKAKLLRGETDDALGAQAGELLGAMIRAAADVREGFDELALFEQLRLDPYYGFTARQHPHTILYFEELSEDCRRRRVSLVHGDFSPKNFLVARRRLMAIDWECVHFGNPAFDAAFLLNHLLLKSFHSPRRQAEYAAVAQAFWRALEPDIAELEWFPGSAMRHWAGLLLARIDGKSPVEYLDEETRSTVRRFAIDLIAHPGRSVDDVFERRSQWR